MRAAAAPRSHRGAFYPPLCGGRAREAKERMTQRAPQHGLRRHRRDHG